MKKITSKIIGFLKKIRRYNYRKFRQFSEKDFLKRIQKMYFLKTGEKMSLSNPEKFTEKIQLYKLEFLYNDVSKLVDKIEVTDWVKSKIGPNYVNSIYGVWDKFENIDFSILPEKFVLKTNHGAGMNVVVENKNAINHRYLKRVFNNWLRVNYAYEYGLELQYRSIKPKIYAEKFMSDKDGNLNDYKFICFNGTVYYCWVDIGRSKNHTRNIYDLEWNLQSWNIGEFPNCRENISKPFNFSEMISIASKLSEGFSHVRVDLFNIDGKIVFGEMTFTTGSGFSRVNPQKYDYILGSLWEMN